MIQTLCLGPNLTLVDMLRIFNNQLGIQRRHVIADVVFLRFLGRQVNILRRQQDLSYGLIVQTCAFTIVLDHALFCELEFAHRGEKFMRFALHVPRKLMAQDTGVWGKHPASFAA